MKIRKKSLMLLMLLVMLSYCWKNVSHTKNDEKKVMIDRFKKKRGGEKCQ